MIKQLKNAGCFIVLLCFAGCNGFFKNDFKDNSPTSGRLKVYYDEGLELHVKNQAITFQSQYGNARLDLFTSNEEKAVEALYNDSCEAILISRLLTEEEKKAFESKVFFPKYSEVAKSGVAVITNIQTPLNFLTIPEIKQFLTVSGKGKDSTGNDIEYRILLDKNNSGVMHYLLDSVTRTSEFAAHCNALNGTLDAINFVAANKNVIAFIDFAWLSDVDDPIYKSNNDKIKFIAIENNKKEYCYPDQSNFKLGKYPFTRSVYLYRKTGDFTLAKGFESYVAGPKGQLTFLKQGLLPQRQGERKVKINLEPIKE